MPTRPDVLDALRHSLDRELEALTKMTSLARDEATGGESKAENKYDTRATEASYLAAGQGQRLLGLQRLAGWARALDPHASVRVIGVGALAQLELDDREQWMLLAPEGGADLAVGSERVRLISGASPLGAALMGLVEGDAAEVHTPRGTQQVEVLSVR